MTSSASFCWAQISQGHLDRAILFPAWPLPERETNHADVAELEIVAERVNDCVLRQLRDGWKRATPKPRQAVSWKKESLISWTGSSAGYWMGNKAELIKIKELRLHHCHAIQAAVSLGCHLLMDKGGDAPIHISSGETAERMRIMFSRDASVFPDVNRGHVFADFPNHTQLSRSLGLSMYFSSVKPWTVCYLDDDVVYVTEIF